MTKQIFTLEQASDQDCEAYLMTTDADIFFEEDDTFELTDDGHLVVQLQLTGLEWDDNAPLLPYRFADFTDHSDGGPEFITATAAITLDYPLLWIPVTSELGQALIARGLVSKLDDNWMPVQAAQ